MAYAIGVIVLLLALLIIGLIVRRKHNAEIGRLEKEKMQIQHYPIYEELTKVKALNMNGETEERFERWRNRWTEVVDVQILKIDSMLFDAEEYIDRFKFKKAKEIEREIDEQIVICDEVKNEIIKELEELMGSEEKNRIEIEQLKQYYRSARKTILAHQFSFGSALPKIEEKLDIFPSKLEEFDRLTEEGNYLQAREIVLTLADDAQTMVKVLSEVPALLNDVQTKIPSDIEDLRSGQNEMEEQKYYLGHLELTNYLDELETELVSLKQNVANLDLKDVGTRVNDIHDEIDKFYDLLENEVHAKSYVDRHCEPLFNHITNIIRTVNDLNDEAIYVQQSYRLQENEAEIPKNCLKQLEVLRKRYEILYTRVHEEKSAYSILKEELQVIEDGLERIQEEQMDFSSKLKNLRVDENTARDELETLKKTLQNTERLLHRANMPGIPQEMDARLEESEEKLFIVSQAFEEIPLNMEFIHNSLIDARKCIKETEDKATEMVLNVQLIERIIQYGNRYRASNPTLDAQLREAERSFHQFRYVKALEDAASAVESVEQGAIKRIEALVQKEFQ